MGFHIVMPGKGWGNWTAMEEGITQLCHCNLLNFDQEACPPVWTTDGEGRSACRYGQSKTGYGELLQSLVILGYLTERNLLTGPV